MCDIEPDIVKEVATENVRLTSRIAELEAHVKVLEGENNEVIEISRQKTYIGTFSPRPLYNGAEMKPELKNFIGCKLVFDPLWICDEDERYTGEWAMRCVDLPVSWIASGDISGLTPLIPNTEEKETT